MNLTKQQLFENLKTESKFLYEEGYILEIKEKSVIYTKLFSSGKYIIDFSVLDYSELKVSGLSAKILFNEIEIPLSAAMEQNPEHTIYSIANPIEYNNLNIRRTTNNIHFTISNIEQLDTFIIYLKSFYVNEVLPFQKNYNSIKDVSEWLECTDFNIHSKLLNNGDGTFMFRKLLILKLSGSEGFNLLYEQYKNHLTEKAQENEITYTRLVESFKKLKSHFNHSHEA